jgi:hypothetical protein
MMSLPPDCELGDLLTIEEIEAGNLYDDDGRVPHVPFGFNNGAWIAFKLQAQPGDKFHPFASSPESWSKLRGRAGYVLMRGDEMVDIFVTILN